MKKLCVIIFIVISNFASIIGQSVMRGKITDSNGEELVGATVTIKGTTIGVITDFDGSYSLEIPGSSPLTIVVSYIGYHPVEIEITSTDKVIIQNFTLLDKSHNLEEVVITARGNRGSEGYLEKVKMKSATSIDYISIDKIKKTGDSQIDDALKRVTGVSTVGGYITVRGLTDRYIKTTINGSRIPTLDDFTNNIKLDIFPTSLINNVIIYKTCSPDVPSDWAGSYVSVETKQFPNKLFLTIKSSFGYNNQSTFESVISSKQSPTDWLGYDDGFRDIQHPDFLVNGSFTSPSSRDIFIVAGLENYMTKQGFPEQFETGSIYFRMALVELGFLAPGYINTPTSSDEYANALYQLNQYYQQAFYNVNKEYLEFNKSFPNNWIIIKRKAPLDYSQDFTVGNQINLFGKPLGFLAGFRYSSSIAFDPSTKKQMRLFLEDGDQYTLDTSEIGDNFDRQICIETHKWSALFNTSYKFSKHHSISLTFMPNLMGKNEAIADSGVDRSILTGDGDLEYLIRNSQYYEERKQIVYQAQSTHYFPRIKLKAQIDASYTDGEGSTPDVRSFDYGKISTDHYNYYPSGTVSSGATYERIYLKFMDDILDSRISMEIPILNKPGLVRKLKFGAAYLENTKEWIRHNYFLKVPSVAISENAFEDFFGPDSYDTIVNGLPQLYYTSQANKRNSVVGFDKTKAAYLMLDMDILRWFRFAGGVRAEQNIKYTDQSTTYDDTNPGYTSEFAGYNENIDYMPSANLIFKVLDNSETNFNVRLNYSKSLARPSIREMAPTMSIDFTIGNFWIMGNPYLKNVYTDNYDIRFESYFKNGDNITTSLFYKTFENHIQFVQVGYYTWENTPDSKVSGIEIEGKKQLVKGLEFMGNITLIKSRTTIERKKDGYVKDAIDIPMFGQAPYIINGILSYTEEKIGLSTSLSYNVQGQKLWLVNYDVPNLYELPEHMLDAKIIKDLGKYFSVELKIRNILNAPKVIAYEYEGYSIKWKEYRFGTSYIIGISYTLN